MRVMIKRSMEIAAKHPNSWQRSYDRLLKAVHHLPASGRGDAAALDSIYILLWYLMEQTDIPGVSDYPEGFQWAKDAPAPKPEPTPFQTRMERKTPKKREG